VLSCQVSVIVFLTGTQKDDLLFARS
jgi:hypothetical protein